MSSDRTSRQGSRVFLPQTCDDPGDALLRNTSDLGQN